MKEKDKPFFGVIFILIIIVITLISKGQQDNDIINNGKSTIGIITKYQFSNYSYTLTYKYYIKGTEYSKSIGIDFFKCDDGTKGCLGKKFKVMYLPRNPKKSIIDLGKFNKKKHTSLSL